MLTGKPGCGKTAVAGRLAQFLQGSRAAPKGLESLASRSGRLTAVHFCHAGKSLWTNPRIFTESLALQLAAHPAFAAALVRQSQKHDDPARRPVQVIHQEVETVAEGGEVTGIINRIENISVGAIPPEDAFIRTVHQPLEAVHDEDPGSQVIILVDGLDESLVYSGPTGIVSLLAQTAELPANVHLLLTSRRTTRVLSQFKGARVVDISAKKNDKDNRRDIVEYVLARCKEDERLTPKVESGMALTLAEGIADKAQGNFQYAHSLLRAMALGLRPVEDLEGLPEGLDNLYHDSVQRVVALGKRDWTTEYAPLLGLLSVVQESVTAGQLRSFSGQGESQFDRNLDDLRQFISAVREPRGPEADRYHLYHLYHQSIVDFLSRKSVILEGERLDNQFRLAMSEWHRRIGDYYLDNYEGAWSSYLDEEDNWAELDFGLRHLVTHLAAGLPGSAPKARHDRTGQLIQTVLDPDFQQTHIERLDDIPGLLRDLERAMACAVANRHKQAAEPLTRLALGLVAFRRQHLRPEPIFELALQGDLEAAERRLGLFGMERHWRWTILLLLAWLAPKEAAGRARELCDQCDAFLAGQELTVFEPVARLLERVRVSLDGDEWFGTMSGRVVEEYEVAAILQMVGGADPEAVEGFTLLHGKVSGEQDSGEPVYQATLHSPPLVTYAWAHPGDGTRFFQQYASAHANNSYERYRNLSLWELVKAILFHPGQVWVRDRAVELASGALAGSSVHFQSALRLAVLGMIGWHHDPEALDRLDEIQDAAIKAAGELVPMRGKADTWGHHLRRLCGLAEVYALIFGDQEKADSLIDTARKVHFGFSGFWAPARLTLAETIQLCRPGDVTAMLESVDAAAVSAHNTQDYVFCARVTARVNAMRERWWPPGAFDVEAEIAEFVANPGDGRFASRHRVLEGYEGRLPDTAIRLIIPGWVRKAKKMSVLAQVYERPAEQVALLNPDVGMDVELDAADRVNIPDPDFAPLLAARFAAEALARKTLQPRRKVRLIQTLVPLTTLNPTALDTILARLLMADPGNDKLEAELTGVAKIIQPELAHPKYDKLLDSLAYTARQLGPT